VKLAYGIPIVGHRHGYIYRHFDWFMYRAMYVRLGSPTSSTKKIRLHDVRVVRSPTQGGLVSRQASLGDAQWRIFSLLSVRMRFPSLISFSDCVFFVALEGRCLLSAEYRPLARSLDHSARSLQSVRPPARPVRSVRSFVYWSYVYG
jgi:hypothetical protein